MENISENVAFDILVVTGLSGAGKSETINILEDLGGYCIDNLPPELIPEVIKLRGNKPNNNFVAIVIDVRTEQSFDAFFDKIKWLENNDYNYEILFLDCADDMLIKRFINSNRLHPLYESGEKRLKEYITLERDCISKIRRKAGYIIDTSQLSVLELRNQIEQRIFEGDLDKNIFTLHFISFGYKNGVPLDSDIIYDVRFIPAPDHIERYKFLSGKDEEVKNYVLQWQETKEYLEMFTDLLMNSISYYIDAGKSKLSISIGGKNGTHTPVVIVDELENTFTEEYKTKKTHRDLSS